MMWNSYEIGQKISNSSWIAVINILMFDYFEQSCETELKDALNIQSNLVASI